MNRSKIARVSSLLAACGAAALLAACAGTYSSPTSTMGATGAYPSATTSRTPENNNMIQGNPSLPNGASPGGRTDSGGASQ